MLLVKLSKFKIGSLFRASVFKHLISLQTNFVQTLCFKALLQGNYKGSAEGATTFSITTLNIMAFCIKDLIVTFNMKDTQHNDTRHHDTQHYCTWHYDTQCNDIHYKDTQQIDTWHKH
jgi:hypothetical protein